jgi:2-C-methyl-D-erythritol 4-phosphate cytidylyltransferase
MEKLAVILPAAGMSSRFGGKRNKLEEMLGGETVLRRSVLAFIDRADVAEVIVAANDLGKAREAVGDARVKICAGGTNRAESVKSALAHVSNDIQWIAIHDAARPLVSQELIACVFAEARKHGAAAPALPVALTIKQAHGPLPAKVLRTVPRGELWAMQTPQVMRKSDLLEAYARCAVPLGQITDDIQLLEMLGREVYLVNGEERNLKITTRADLVLAEHFLREP